MGLKGKRFFMIIDVSIALILIICIFIGDRKGFFRSFMSTFGWIVSFAGSYFLRDYAITIVNERTTMYNEIFIKVTEFIKARMEHAATGDDIAGYGSISGSVASIIKNSANSAVQAAAEKAAAPITDAIFALLIMVIVVVVIRLCTYLIERIIGFFIDESKTLSSLDSVMGMLFSLIKGCLLSFFLLVIVYMAGIMGDIPQVLDQISSSMVCVFLIDSGIIPNVFNISV